MKQIQARVIASLVEVAGGRTQEWFDGLKPVDQKKYLKEHPNSKFGGKNARNYTYPDMDKLSDKDKKGYEDLLKKYHRAFNFNATRVGMTDDPNYGIAALRKMERQLKRYEAKAPSRSAPKLPGKRKAQPTASDSNVGKSLNKHKDEVTNVRQATAKMRAIKEELEKFTRAKPRTEEGKKKKALAIRKLTKLYDGIQQHKENMSKLAGKTGAKDQPAPKPKYWWGSSPYKQVKLKDLTDRYGTGFENNVKETTAGGENLGLRLTPEAQKANYPKARAFLEKTGFKLGPEDLNDLTAAARGSVQGLEGFAERLAARKKVQTDPNFAQDFARTLLGVKDQTQDKPAPKLAGEGGGKPKGPSRR